MTVDPSIVTALASNPSALAAYLAACNGQPAPDQVSKPATRKGANPRSSARKAEPRKQAQAQSKANAKARGKAKQAKAVPSEWVVNPEWAGQPTPPRMLAAAIYWGIPSATCSKLAKDKLACSLAIAKQRGIPVAK